MINYNKPFNIFRLIKNIIYGLFKIISLLNQNVKF